MEKDYFHKSEVEPQELFCILLDHFSQAEGTKFQRPGTQHFLEIASDEAGNIKFIRLSNDFPSSELEEIEKKIQATLLAEHGIKVCQMICFCHTEISGYFRYKDLFQILPLPGYAATSFPPITDHPFILEISYKASLDPFVDSARKIEKVVIYTRLLNLLVNRAISSGRWYSRSKWVFNTKDPSTVTEWASLGYFDPTLKDSMENFSLVDGLSPIEKVPYLEYYYLGYPPEQSSKPLSLPDNLEQSIDKAFALDKSTESKFFMACSWYAQYHHIAEASNSSAFVALVTALECLAQEKEVCTVCNQPLLKNDDEICQSCGQPRYRVTKHFQDFLKKYFPLIDQFPKEKKTLYQVRSSLAHGMNLLQADLEPWKLLFDAKKQQQNLLQRNLYYIVGIAIFHWLHSI